MSRDWKIFPANTVWFRDEAGTEGTYRYQADQFERVCERAEARLGLKPDAGENLRFARAKAMVKVNVR